MPRAKANTESAETDEAVTVPRGKALTKTQIAELPPLPANRIYMQHSKTGAVKDFPAKAQASWEGSGWVLVEKDPA